MPFASLEDDSISTDYGSLTGSLSVSSARASCCTRTQYGYLCGQSADTPQSLCLDGVATEMKSYSQLGRKQENLEDRFYLADSTALIRR
jgi:hypothetical protein